MKNNQMPSDRADCARQPMPEPGDYTCCDRIQETLMEYISGELGERASNLVREHLRDCQTCRAEAAAMMSAMNALKKLDHADGPDPKLSEKSFTRLMWLWSHPFWAWCYKWHHAVSALIAVILVAALLVFLYKWKWHEPQLPESYPPTQILLTLPPGSADIP